MLRPELDHDVGAELAVLAANLDPIARAGLLEVERADRAALVDGVDLIRARGAQLEGALVLALELGAQAERDRGAVLGDAEGVGGLGGFSEGQGGLAGRRDPAEIGGRGLELDLAQEL